MNEESFPVASTPLGPARVLGVGATLDAMPCVAIVIRWPESPDADVTSRLTPDEARRIADSLYGYADEVDERSENAEQ